jgi:hypothetical protein
MACMLALAPTAKQPEMPWLLDRISFCKANKSKANNKANKSQTAPRWRRSILVGMFPDVAVEQAAEETYDVFPGGGENGEAGRHKSDNALKNDASRAWIQIGSRIRHASDREIRQCERQQDIFLCSIHRQTLGAVGAL